MIRAQVDILRFNEQLDRHQLPLFQQTSCPSLTLIRLCEGILKSDVCIMYTLVEIMLKSTEVSVYVGI
jgi:hypothetical protein